jgi:tetratricopeptide (TPR) repeat protein
MSALSGDTRKTGLGSGLPPKELASFSLSCRRAAAPFALLSLAGVIVVSSVLAAAATPPAKARPDSPAFTALAAKAQAAREAGHPDEALHLYGEALKLKPTWTEGWWFSGTIYYEGDQYEQGRDAFRHLLSNDSKMAAAWGMLGLCEFQTKQYPEALAHLQRANALGLGGHDEIRDVVNYHRALLFTREGEFDQAMGLVAVAVIQGKDNPRLVEAMGIAALRKPLLPSELPPTERELVMDVGRALCDGSARRIADATTEFEVILKKYPDTPQLHYLYGLILVTGDPDQAVEQFKAELTLSPRHYEALYSIAREYDKRSDFATAVPFAKRAVDVNPTFAPAHALLGKVLVDSGSNVALGIGEIETAIKMNPANPQNHYLLAMAYGRVGRPADAARERAEFIKLRKDAPPVEPTAVEQK